MPRPRARVVRPTASRPPPAASFAFLPPSIAPRLGAIILASLSSVSVCVSGSTSGSGSPFKRRPRRKRSDAEEPIAARQARLAPASFLARRFLAASCRQMARLSLGAFGSACHFLLATRRPADRPASPRLGPRLRLSMTFGQTGSGRRLEVSARRAARVAPATRPSKWIPFRPL